MIDIVEIKPHTAEGKIINNNVLSIFLAGTIDMGDSEDWQHDVKLRFEEFAKKNFSKNNVNSLEDLYLEVAKSNVSAKTIVSKYAPELENGTIEQTISRQIERNNRILMV